MSGKTKNLWLIVLLIAAANLCLIGAAPVRAQDEDARRLWDGAFLKKRAEAKTPSANSSARKTTGYRRATPKKPAAQIPAPQPPASQTSASQNPPSLNNPDEKADGEMIGLTIWRLRASRAADSEDTRLLLEDESKKEIEWTPERVEADTVFAAGDRVRLGIESPRNGYLYVIDREQYADGTVSDPYLIFPTLRNRDGANSVAAGKLIELPERSAFRLKPMRPDYTGEVLTVLVTPEPLKDVKPGSGATKLDSEMVARLESQWAGAVERFELVGGAGKPYTKAEKEAGQDGARILTQDDAMPQTLYHVSVKPGAPLLVT
ncbi:MAG: hypothetical protein ACREAB_07955, partial [Blastocatellia bacterium]